MLTRSTKPHSLRILPDTPLPRAIHPSSPSSAPYLGGDYKEGSLRGQAGQCFGDVGPINVRDKPDTGTSFRVRLESFSHHEGSQVRAPDADVDDVRDGFASVPFPVTTPDPLSQKQM